MRNQNILNFERLLSQIKQLPRRGGSKLALVKSRLLTYLNGQSGLGNGGT